MKNGSFWHAIYTSVISRLSSSHFLFYFKSYSWSSLRSKGVTGWYPSSSSIILNLGLCKFILSFICSTAMLIEFANFCHLAYVRELCIKPQLLNLSNLICRCCQVPSHRRIIFSCWIMQKVLSVSSLCWFQWCGKSRWNGAWCAYNVLAIHMSCVVQ